MGPHRDTRGIGVVFGRVLASGEMEGVCGCCGKGYLSLGFALLLVQALLGLLDLVEVGLHELELGLQALQLFTRFFKDKS